MWQKNIWRSMGVLVQVTFLHSYKGFFLCSVESSKKGSYWMEILVNLTLCDSLLLHWCSTVTWKEPQSCTKLACGHWRGVCMCIFFFFFRMDSMIVLVIFFWSKSIFELLEWEPIIKMFTCFQVLLLSVTTRMLKYASFVCVCVYKKIRIWDA